jgi:hypothetical protein
MVKNCLHSKMDFKQQKYKIKNKITSKQKREKLV